MPIPVTSVITLQDPTCAPTDLACPGYIEGNGAAFSGPLAFGGALYTFGRRLAEAANPNAACVFKSVDNGATWAEQNAAGAPLMRSNGVPTPISPAVYDTVNGFLHICYTDQSSPFHLFYVRFSLLTDTYGAPVDSGIVSSPGLASARICLRSDGSCVLFFPFGGNLRYITITSQVFGASTLLVAAGTAAYACAVDGVDTCYIAYRTGANPTALVTLTTGGVVSAPSAISADIPSQVSWMLLWNDRILIPYTTPFNGGDLNASNKAKFWQGTPIAAPVWTSNDLHDGLPGTLPDGSIVRDRAPMVVQFDAGTVYFGWGVEGYDDPLPDSIVSLYVSTYDGVTIGAPLLIWDEIANPPPGATGLTGSDYQIFAVSAIFSGLTLRFVVYAAANQDLQQSMTLVDAEFAPPPPLTVECDSPPLGRVGVDYDHTFLADGGTLPYVFSLDAGTLPPGLTLNAATGELTGKPTRSGFFEFTIKVTDADETESTVDCSILIKRCLLVDLTT